MRLLSRVEVLMNTHIHKHAPCQGLYIHVNAQERSKERKGTLVLGSPRPSQLLCTADQLYFSWSKFRPRLPPAILEPIH